MERILKRIVIDENTGCWNWQGSLDTHGYGRLYSEGKDHGAHRIAYEEWYGEISDGLCVLHKCDNPKCVNPDHLFLGTQQHNLKDMRAKGRGSYGGLKQNIGEHNPSSKLSDSQIAEIRRLKQETRLTQQSIANMFNVHNSYICMLLKGDRRKLKTPITNADTTKKTASHLINR